MAKNLVPLTIGTPGFYGLNTQDAGSVLPPGWATKAENCVYDDVGRLASRRGYQQLNGTAITGSPTVEAVYEHLDASGNRVIILAANNKIWKEVNGTITDVTGTITTPTANNWQFTNFNGWIVGYQEGHSPIVSTSATTPAFADGSGTQFDGSMVLSAYGRLWTVYQNTLYYSDLLINDFGSGSAGSLDLAKYWPGGMDEAVALSDFNGFLVVFGKRSIIVYENADDVDNIAIVETIDGVGCPYRDSVQTVSDDLVFLSNSGLRSLKETLRRQGAERLTEISRHVRDQLLIDLTGETPVEVKGVYNERLGFYLLSFPTLGKSYYFDTRFKNSDDSWRITTWDLAPTAMYYADDTTHYMALTDGYLATYTGYQDAVDSSGDNGVAYNMDFVGVWNDFGEEVGSYLKVLKGVSVLAAGISGGTVTFKWAVDYQTSFNNLSLTFSTNQVSQYAVAQYATNVYSASSDFERVRSQLSKAGQVIQPGLLASIDGYQFSLQRFDMLAKIGKVRI